jgi:hypothetical protein
MRRLLLVFSLLLMSVCAFGQQDYVGRYDVYGGFGYLESPHINLAERGFHTQLGVNPNTWLSLGFDYSVFTGHTSLTPNLLTLQLQQQLGQVLATVPTPILQAVSPITVPFDSTTHTFAGGPVLNYRHWKGVTLSVHPSIGAIKESVTLNPTNPVTQGIVAVLAPGGKKDDTVVFYGFGGMVDLNASRHVGVRLTADFVHDHLFENLLKDGRNTVRFSIGPSFHFGKNVAK